MVDSSRSTTSIKSVDVRVTGKVQRVFYRLTCQYEAQRLGVRGTVRNDPDGSVSGHFEGAEDAVDELIAWCRVGPIHARVDDVIVTDAPSSGATDFTVS